MATPNSGGFDYWVNGRPLVTTQRDTGGFDYWLSGRPLAVLAAAAITATTVLPDTGSATWAGFAPTLGSPVTVVPGAGTAPWAGFALTAGLPQTVTPGAGAVTWAGFAPILAQAYYVDNAGSDSNSGKSTLLPFLTLAKLSATAFLGPGDIVSLNRGNRWEETLTIRTVGGTGGTAGNPITFTAYGTGADPVLSAADKVTSWTFDTTVAGGDRYSKALAWTPNFAWREDGTLDAGTVTNLFKRTTQALTTALHDWSFVSGTAYVVVDTGEVPGTGLNIHIGRRNVNVNEYTAGPSYITLDHLLLRFQHEGSFYGQIHVASNSTVNNGWVISNVVCEWGGRGIAFGGAGTNSFAQTRMLTMSNVIIRYQRSHGCQLTFLSAGSSLTDCDFIGNGQQGLGVAARDSTFTRCRANNNSNALALWTDPVTVSAFDNAFYVVGQVPNFDRAFGNLFVSCSADSNVKVGFAVDALSGPHTFLRCVSSNNFFGFYLEGGTTNSSSGNALYHCVAFGNHKSALHVINCHGPFEARNNQFYGNGVDGGNQDVYIEGNIGSWTLHSGTPGTDAIYKHSHLDWTPTAVRDEADNILTLAASVGAMTAGTYFHDGVTPEGTLYVRRTSNGVVANVECSFTYELDYNNYTPSGSLPGGNAIIRVSDGVAQNQFYTTVAALFAAQGQEQHGTQHDPLYVNTGTLDFHLQPSSPSIGLGVVITGINDGTLGSVQYQGAAPDLGAFEFAPLNTPGTGTTTWVGFAPVLAASLTVLPGTGTQDWAGFEPTIAASLTVVPGASTAAWAGFALTLGLPRTVIPGAGTASWAGYAPVLPHTVVPDLGAVTWAGFAPVLPKVTVTGVGAVTWAGFAPQLDISAIFAGVRQAIINGLISAQSEAAGWNAQRVNIPVSAVVRTSDTVATVTLPALPAYEIVFDEVITDTFPAIALVSGGPVIATPTFGITAQPPPTDVFPETGAASWAGFALTPGLPRTVVLGVGTAGWQGFAPLIGASLTVTPDFGAATWAGFAPTLTSAQTVMLEVGTTAWDGFALTVVLPSDTVLATGTAPWQGFAPTLDAPLTVTLGAAAEATWAGFAPVIAAPLTLLPPPATASWAGYALGSETGPNIVPGVGTAAWDGFAPVVATGPEILPESGTVEWAGFEPTLDLPLDVQPLPGLVSWDGFAPDPGFLPGTAAIEWVGFAPDLSLPLTLLPGVAAVTWEGFDLSVGAPFTDILGLGEVVWLGFAPGINAGDVFAQARFIDRSGYAFCFSDPDSRYRRRTMPC